MSGEKETTDANKPTVLYQEKHHAPLWGWVFGLAVALLIAAQVQHNREPVWGVVTFVIFGGAVVWFLASLSSATVRVEQDPSGERWLTSKGANLPASVVSRSLAIPASAKQSAMGRQLDPAAFLIYHGWVKELAMFVLDDPDDPTPYWLVSSRDPEALIRTFVPEQVDQALSIVREAEA